MTNKEDMDEEDMNAADEGKDKYKDEDEVVKAVIDLAREKYKVEIPEDEIST